MKKLICGVLLSLPLVGCGVVDYPNQEIVDYKFTPETKQAKCGIVSQWNEETGWSSVGRFCKSGNE